MDLTAEGYTSHMGKGKLNFSVSPEQKWKYMPSGTSGESIIKYACKWAKQLK